MSVPEIKKYKKDGSYTVRWLNRCEEERRWQERFDIYAAEDKWYYDHGIRKPTLPLTWRQEEMFLEKQKREKLSSKLTTCVYCGRPVGVNRKNYFRRWNQYVHKNPIGTHRLDRKLEKETFFDHSRICFGCANTEFAIGQATLACETALAKLKKEIRAQAY